MIFQLSRRRPEQMKAHDSRGARAGTPGRIRHRTHFKPRYNPWDQRLCLVPDGDLFAAIRDGEASVVTDHIETFTETGMRLASGAELEADIVVTATGLNLLAARGHGDRRRRPRDRSGEDDELQGHDVSGVPNLAMTLGYTNASWTLKCDLTCEYVCRLIKHMDEHGYRQCTPHNRDSSVSEEPFIDFSSGYILRSIHHFPKQGSKRPWRLHQNYARDILTLRYSAIEDGAMQFSSVPNEIGGVVGVFMDQAGDRMPAHPAKRMLVACASRHVATIEDPRGSSIGPAPCIDPTHPHPDVPIFSIGAPRPDRQLMPWSASSPERTTLSSVARRSASTPAASCARRQIWPIDR